MPILSGLRRLIPGRGKPTSTSEPIKINVDVPFQILGKDPVNAKITGTYTVTIPTSALAPTAAGPPAPAPAGGPPAPAGGPPAPAPAAATTKGGKSRRNLRKNRKNRKTRKN